MACLRGQTTDGRVGVVSCDEEGCLYQSITTGGGQKTIDLTPEADCVLQLQLRAGDAEDTEYSPDPDHEDAGRDSADGPVEDVLIDLNFNEHAFVADAKPEGVERAGESLDQRYRLGVDHAKLYIEPDGAQFDGSVELPAESGGTEGELDPVADPVGWMRAEVSNGLGERDDMGLTVDKQFLVVAHDNGKTEHNRICEHWARQYSQKPVLGHVDEIISDEYGVTAKWTLTDAGREFFERLERKSRVPRDDPERFNWQEWIGEWNHEDLTVSEEFEWLRANPKWSTAQAQRVKHLEEHLDAGDILCKCYEHGRPD